MIAFLEGLVAEKSPTEVLVNVHGVGYRVFISLQTYEHLPEKGQPLVLTTHLIIREDNHLLYGFYDKQEYQLFLNLIGVNGVGPKIAISILSAIKSSDFIQHIAQANIRLLKSIPGVGQKMAERLVVELKDKVSKIHGTGVSDWIAPGHQQNQEDAIAALTALGFSRSVAEKTIAGIIRSGGETMKTDELVRLALRQTVK